MAGDQAELDRLRAEFDRELMRKAMRIAELELQLDRTIQEFASSRSWLVTKPLRLLTALRRRLGAMPILRR